MTEPTNIIILLPSSNAEHVRAYGIRETDESSPLNLSSSITFCLEEPHHALSLISPVNVTYFIGPFMLRESYVIFKENA